MDASVVAAAIFPGQWIAKADAILRNATVTVSAPIILRGEVFSAGLKMVGRGLI